MPVGATVASHRPIGVSGWRRRLRNDADGPQDYMPSRWHHLLASFSFAEPTSTSTSSNRVAGPFCPTLFLSPWLASKPANPPARRALRAASLHHLPLMLCVNALMPIGTPLVQSLGSIAPVGISLSFYHHIYSFHILLSGDDKSVIPGSPVHLIFYKIQK